MNKYAFANLFAPIKVKTAITLLFAVLFLAPINVIAGDPEPSTPPGTGTMKTLDEIYDKLDLIDGKLGGSPPNDGSYISIPETGQKQAYETGDDGYYQKGATWPDPRFTKNGVSSSTPAGDGTVTDNLTGLVWAKHNFCIKDINWSDAIAAVNALKDGDCQLSDGSVAGDWRLPNVNELASLLDRGHAPALPLDWDDFFVYGGAAYWTSTTYANFLSSAWAVWFTFGHITPNSKSDIGYEIPGCWNCSQDILAVWPVRDPIN